MNSSFRCFVGVEQSVGDFPCFVVLGNGVGAIKFGVETGVGIIGCGAEHWEIRWLGREHWLRSGVESNTGRSELNLTGMSCWSGGCDGVELGRRELSFGLRGARNGSRGDGDWRY